MAAEALAVLDCACASLRRAARAVTQRYEAGLVGTGLTVTQLTLLQVLDMKGASAQGTVGALLALDPTTLSRTLRPLARAGWISAAPGRDRREVRWRVTAAGKRRLARARPAWRRAQAELRGKLRPLEWRRMLEQLAQVAAAARQQ